MAEYIERERLKSILRRFITECETDGDNEEANIFRDVIDITDEIQAADVAPVRHAKWIEYPRAHYFKCSECKYTVPHKKAALISGYRQYNYCPHCGAKMDVEDR